MIVLLSACLPFLIAILAATVFRTLWRPLIRVGGATALVWMWLNACGALNGIYAHLLVPTPWPTRLTSLLIRPDAALSLVLLGGGTELTGPKRQPRPAGDSIEKIALTAAIYQQAIDRQHRAQVVVSGGDPQKHGVAEADNYAPDLISLGIPADAIIKENRSLNTIQNARYVAAILAGQHASNGSSSGDPAAMPGQLILITTAIHMRRALLDFDRQGLQPLAMAPPIHALQRGFWPTVRRMEQADADLHELIGIAQFFVYRKLGWY